MSRSGYSDDCDGWELIRWRGAVTQAIRGRRGQAFLRELLATLDAMPDKRLIAHDLESRGEVCAIGSVGRARGIDMSGLSPECAGSIAEKFGIARALVKEIEFENDDDFGFNCGETPEQRFKRVRAWVAEQIV
jgi:hypothetical protein